MNGAAISRPRRPPAHPRAARGNRTSALGMTAGQRVIVNDGRRGWVDEFLADGDAFFTDESGQHDEVKWVQLSPEPAESCNAS